MYQQLCDWRGATSNRDYCLDPAVYQEVHKDPLGWYRVYVCERHQTDEALHREEL